MSGSRPKSLCPWRVLSLADWPEGERQAWEAAISPSNPFNRRAGALARRRPATLDLYLSAYGNWLGWLEFAGGLGVALPPGSRATLGRVTDYWKAMCAAGLADYTVAIRLFNLVPVLKVVAPDEDWRWIGRAAGRIAHGAKRRTDLRTKMRAPEDVVRLGRELMECADRGDGGSAQADAILYRDGLLLALQTFRALRGRNLSDLELGRTLYRSGDGWKIDFSADEMKGRRAFAMPWPRSLTTHLERYLEQHRAALTGATFPFGPEDGPLWFSPSGQPMGAGLIRKRLKKNTGENLGAEINTHSFRHIAATTLAEANPEGGTEIAGLLAHSSLGISEKYYNQARQIAAGDRYAQILEARRRAGGVGRRKSTTVC
jgi:integrase/recombinase XerD